MVFGITFGPDWFHRIDALFEIFTFFVTILIALYSHKFFKISRQKHYKYFSIALGLIALSFLFKLAVNITTGYDIFGAIKSGVVVQGFKLHQIYYTIATFLAKFLMLLGLYSLYAIISKQADKKTHIIALFLILAVTLASKTPFLAFHLTAALFFGLIALHYFYNYRKKLNKKIIWLAASFSTLALGELIFSITFIQSAIFAAATIVSFIGYAILLYIFISVLKK